MVRHVYCDQALGGGADNGTSWTDAYRLLATALNGSNVIAGDFLWVKNDQLTSDSVSFIGPAAWTNDPPQIIGCKPGASNTPPIASEIVPGIRTGPNAVAYTHADAPIFATSVASADILIKGWFSFYGIVFKARDNFTLPNDDSKLFMEECELRTGDGESGIYFIGSSGTGNIVMQHFRHCKFSAGSGGDTSNTTTVADFLFEKCVWDITASRFIVPAYHCRMTFDSCDFTADTATLVAAGGGRSLIGQLVFHNCAINGGSSLTSGVIDRKFRTEFFGVSSVTGKTTGQSFQEVDIITDNGTITLETTGIRDGGADDGGTGGWSLAYLPEVDGTRNNREGLTGPWHHMKIAGDGTSQTLTIFIANNEGVDYQTDDVHAEVFFPSANGDADYDLETTQLVIQGSATDVDDDVVSSWTAPAANPQKFVIAISPDYTGRLRWRVVFTRNFGTTPKILYVDGLATIT